MSRQITDEMVQAFMNNKNAKKSNTEIHTDCTGTYMYLFGNCIAKKVGERVAISLCGYNTLTTRERLNGILRLFNKFMTTKKGKVYIKGFTNEHLPETLEIETDRFIIISNN